MTYTRLSVRRICLRTQQSCGFLLVAAGLLFSTATPAVSDGPVHHVHISGQSLARGVMGYPALSVQGSEQHLMFANGLFGGVASAFAPLSQAYVETIASGMAETVSRLQLMEDGAADHRILATMWARGATRISRLDKAGGDPYGIYHDSLRHFWIARLLADYRNLPYVPSALLWLQGESDLVLGTTREQYRKRLLRLQADYEADVARVAGYPLLRLPMLTYQTNAMTLWRKFDAGNIALAQHDASRTSDSIYLVGPIYPFDYMDGLHPTNHSYRHLGAYFGKVYKRVVLDGEDWKPLQPREARLRGTRIQIDFDVPVPPLQFDSESINDPGDYGFVIEDRFGRVPIVGIRISGPETVEIRTMRSPVGQAQVRYAYDGPDLSSFLYLRSAYLGARGNLRDSDPAQGFGRNAQGEPYTLPNWSVVFALTVAQAAEQGTDARRDVIADYYPRPQGRTFSQ